MKRTMLILIVIAMLLSGCIGGSKSGNSKTGNNGDEYGNDNSIEDDESGVVQADYNSLDLSSKDQKVQNVQSTIYANKTINIFDNATVKASLETSRR
jgi:uncharacterized protein YceK